MTKKESSVEVLKLDIELADNGIIIRNPECEDEVTIAVTPKNEESNTSLDITDSNTAIGRKIYDWLMDVVIQKHCNELITTGFSLYISAKCVGRPMDD